MILLLLAGTKIPHNKSIKAHSDGDVVIHALIDALLGATGKGNIGLLFPDTNDKYKNIDSKILLEKVINMIKDDDYKINNIDATIICQAPRLSPYVDKMRETLSKIIDLDIMRISIKPKTAEKLGDIGKGNALSCMCSVLVQRVSDE